MDSLSNKYGYLYFFNKDSFEVNFVADSHKKYCLGGKNRPEDENEVTVNIYSDDDNIYIDATAARYGVTRDLYFLSVPREHGRRYEIRCNSLTAPGATPLVMGRDFNLHWEYVDGRDYFETAGKTLEINKFLSPKEAKAVWKYIKSKGYVSRWVWDPYMGYYDCYCNACAVGRQASWLGNPDIGYVREVPVPGLGDFEYKGKYYSPCAENEYDRLKFWNESEYEKVRASYESPDYVPEAFERDFPPFEKLWEKRLSQEEIDGNGNIEGGCYRRALQGGAPEIFAEESKGGHEGGTFEKVVTLGWHGTDPVRARRCPVCDDIYNVMRSGWGGMLPWNLRLASRFKRTKEWK